MSSHLRGMLFHLTGHLALGHLRILTKALTLPLALPVPLTRPPRDRQLSHSAPTPTPTPTPTPNTGHLAIDNFRADRLAFKRDGVTCEKVAVTRQVTLPSNPTL